MSEITKQLRFLPHFHALSGVSVMQINQAETHLALNFHNEYRDY